MTKEEMKCKVYDLLTERDKLVVRQQEINQEIAKLQAEINTNV
jgi:hypothetical protein